ncbi:uncharacterized protein LOC131878744 [Tigriopus californicus]|uniref:uncharacterized protein LOC131878744 n=1 Tax=Tigriopus californicus TaxID=6832 RepID=UPI0027D9E7C3|nr:uncharacterized protein LOC131878744 [Tigriopus californicus]
MSGSDVALNESQKMFHCFACKKIFASHDGIRKHETAPNKHGPPCKETNHEHQLVNEEFATIELAKEWLLVKEFDKIFTIFTSRPDYIRYQCRHVRSKQTPKKNPTKNVPSIPFIPCTAKLFVDKIKVCKCSNNLTNTCESPSLVYRVRGCTTHSHEIEIRYNRISGNTKAMLISLLQAGIPKKTVLEQYCSFENYSNMNQKLITSMDLRNLEKLHVNNGIDLKKSDFENICDLMERPDFRGFSFTDLEHDPNTVPSTISDKLIPNATKSMIVYASEEMLSQFHKYPVTLFVDGTHGTNKSKYSLISFVVADTRGEGVPIMIVIAKTESKEVIIPALEILQHLAPEALSNVKALVSDMSPSFINAWKHVVPSGDVRHVKCAWHLQNAWKRELLPQRLEFYQSLCRLRLVADEREFWVQFYKIRHD